MLLRRVADEIGYGIADVFEGAVGGEAQDVLNVEQGNGQSRQALGISRCVGKRFVCNILPLLRNSLTRPHDLS